MFSRFSARGTLKLRSLYRSSLAKMESRPIFLDTLVVHFPAFFRRNPYSPNTIVIGLGATADLS